MNKWHLSEESIHPSAIGAGGQARILDLSNFDILLQGQSKVTYTHKGKRVTYTHKGKKKKKKKKKKIAH